MGVHIQFLSQLLETRSANAEVKTGLHIIKKKKRKDKEKEKKSNE